MEKLKQMFLHPDGAPKWGVVASSAILGWFGMHLGSRVGAWMGFAAGVALGPLVAHVASRTLEEYRRHKEPGPKRAPEAPAREQDRRLDPDDPTRGMDFSYAPDRPAAPDPSGKERKLLELARQARETNPSPTLAVSGGPALSGAQNTPGAAKPHTGPSPE
jgi:hypothetical protein